MSVIETGDGSPTLFNQRYDESYHSTFGAATESRYVFLETSGVQARLETGLSTHVLEIGFGLGLNALLTCDMALTHCAALNYHAFEHDHSICTLAQQVDYSPLLENPSLALELQKQLREQAYVAGSKIVATDTSPTAATTATQATNTLQQAENKQTCASLIQLSPNTTIELHWEDVARAALPAQKFDAIYLDAFSPDNNPECWTPEFFELLRNSLATDGKMSTYCAKGVVRRAMIAAGFTVQKLPGPPGKREIMVASLVS